jgi:hypothetical protein
MADLYNAEHLKEYCNWFQRRHPLKGDDDDNNFMNQRDIDDTPMDPYAPQNY